MSLQNERAAAEKTTTKNIKLKEKFSSCTQNTLKSKIYTALNLQYIQVKPKLMVYRT